MPLPRTRGLVCVVTDRRRLLPGGDAAGQRHALVDQARAAANAGVDLLQIREGDLGGRALHTLVGNVLAAVAGSTTRVLVNDRLDVALAAGADGVHMRGSGLRPSLARSLASRPFLIGQSIHGDEEVDEAADFAIFGTVFPSPSKGPGHGIAGVGGLEAASRRSRAPVLAIGGLTEATVGEVAAVSSGVAAIGWFATTDARQMLEAVRRVRAAFDTIAPVI